MSHFKPYPAYRPSGVEWIGDVPEHWEVKPIKILATYNDDVLPDSTAADSPIKYVDISAVSYSDGIGSTEDMLFGNAPSRARRKAKSGDVVISTVRTYLKAVAAVDEAHADCVYSTGFAVLRARDGHIEPNFLKWLALNELFIQSVESHSEGLSYPAINAPELVNLKTAIPSFSEQAKIASTLDRETKRIDSLIAKKTRFVELLKEKRQALITHAVTKGLDPNVKMRNSGVEWIGEVPHHWTLTTLKRVSSIRYGIGEPPPYKAEGVRLVRATNVNAGEIQERGMVLVDPNDIPAGRIVWLKSGDIVVVRSGAYTGDSAIVPEEYPSAIAGFDMVLRCTGAISQFIQFSLLSPYVKVAQIDPQTMRAAQPHLNAEELGNCVIAAPSLDEQEEIASYLIKQCGVIDLIARKTQHSIDLLKERRSAFITAAVTGQIDLRESV